MSGFVSCPPSTAPDPAAPDLDLVAGDDFYPPVSIAEARESLRVNTMITDPRLRDALRGGMISVRKDLAAWKAARVAAGALSLADLDEEEVDGVGMLELLYRRAVFAYAGADLAETHNDITATAEGKDRIETGALTAGEHRHNATHAVRDIIGATRTSVELI